MSGSKGVNAGFDWTPQPAGAALVRSVLDPFLNGFTPAGVLSEQMRDKTGTRFLDWVDTIYLPDRQHDVDAWRKAGFEPAAEPGVDGLLFRHPGAVFPSIVMHRSDQAVVAVKVESVQDFLFAHGLDGRVPIEGQPLAPLRIAVPWADDAHALSVIERHGSTGYRVEDPSPRYAADVLRHAELLVRRQRAFADPADGFSHARSLIQRAIDDLGVDRACDLFFHAERRYWQSRNHAARAQKARQDSLGLGWANHDHHTYRSSRVWFSRLIGALEQLGFVPRERFYAGAEAGWGAQVMEQRNAGITVFADVDMSPQELVGDFAHNGLSPARSLGTVGLWCALHGEAFLEAGMHHLECQFDFARLREQLGKGHGIGMMAPFTDFEFLKQAFTQGERWPVSGARIRSLLSTGLIDAAQARRFSEEGAIGSHLENLQRDDGFKGFNQTGISRIISATDPRAG